MATPTLGQLGPLTLLCLQLGWGAPAAAAQTAPATVAPGAGAGSSAPAATTAPPDAATPAAAVPAPATVATAGTRPGETATVAPHPADGAASVATAACDGEEGPRPSGPTLARLQGVITAPERTVHRVELALLDRATGNRWVINELETCKGGDQHGAAARFAYSTELAPGTYDLTLTGRTYESEVASGVTLAANQVKQLDFSLVKEDNSLHPSILALPVVFLLSIWFIRWNNIAKPSRLAVIGQLRDLQGRFPADSRTGVALAAAQQELQKKVAVLDWLFWSRGQEIASWNLVHQAQIALLEDPAQTSLDKINARLASVEQQLAEMDKSAAASLAHRVAVELECDPAKASEGARRQLLIEAAGYLYEAGDTGFAELTSWQNKAFWLTLVGVALISAVGLTEGHAALFLAGAVGGFLSRLTRELKRADVATDYGASWSTLFLSPVAGAISGWFGVTLVMLMTDPTVGVLGGPLKVINWDSTNVAATLAAAFVLGFSERLFDRIVAQLDTAIDKKKEDAQKTTPKTSPVQRPGPESEAAGKPGIAALSPNPVAAGGELAAQLENLDAAKVTGVVLTGAGGDLPALEPRLEDGQLKVTVAAGTAPGTYRIVLLTPELAPPRLETDEELTVSAAPAG